MSMELETLVLRMKEVPLSRLEEICAQAEVSYSTALKIRGGYTKNPGVLTVKALEPHFQSQEQAAA